MKEKTVTVGWWIYQPLCFSLLLLVLIAGRPATCLAQNGKETKVEKPIPAGLDRLHMRAGRTMDIRLMGIEGDSIYYRMPDGTETYRMTRNRVLFITHKDGRKEQMQKEVREVQWQDIVELRDPKEARKMKRLEHYDEKLTSQNIRKRVKPEKLEAAAIIQLKKRAAARRATHLLIRKVEFVTTYGEPPSLHIIGDAYRQIGTKGKRKKSPKNSEQ